MSEISPDSQENPCVSRRRFLKLALGGGVLATAAYFGLGSIAQVKPKKDEKLEEKEEVRGELIISGDLWDIESGNVIKLDSQIIVEGRDDGSGFVSETISEKGRLFMRQNDRRFLVVFIRDEQDMKIGIIGLREISKEPDGKVLATEFGLNQSEAQKILSPAVVENIKIAICGCRPRRPKNELAI
ncbi:MAG: hypothetical protein V2A63_00290 [Patescibacteria group bacterium]